MHSTNGLGNSPILSERLWQSFASSAVRKVQLHGDLTDQDVADIIGCCAATVGNARNLNGQLAGRTFANLMRIDPYALDGPLNFFGRRSVPIEAKCNTDELVSTSAAVHRLAAVKSPSSDGGTDITDAECLEIEAVVTEALEALSALKQRATAIRAQRAA